MPLTPVQYYRGLRVGCNASSRVLFVLGPRVLQEVGYISRGNPRSSTIIALTQCDLGTIKYGGESRRNSRGRQWSMGGA
jgi:hypothetical protein